jgi:hypothetical protein
VRQSEPSGVAARLQKATGRSFAKQNLKTRIG